MRKKNSNEFVCLPEQPEQTRCGRGACWDRRQCAVPKSINEKNSLQKKPRVLPVTVHATGTSFLTKSNIPVYRKMNKRKMLNIPVSYRYQRYFCTLMNIFCTVLFKCNNLKTECYFYASHHFLRPNTDKYVWQNKKKVAVPVRLTLLRARKQLQGYRK
jgi:hypothetical protein